MFHHAIANRPFRENRTSIQLVYVGPSIARYLPYPYFSPFAIPTHSHHQKPRRAPPDLPLELWLEIFQFATYVHRSVTIKPLDPFTLKRTSTNAMGANTPALAMRTKLALVMVSKSWRQVAVQMLYEHVVIRSPTRADAVLRALMSSNHNTDSPIDKSRYGQWTRHIEIYTYSRGTANLQYLKILFCIFQLCPNLRVLSGTWIHPLPLDFLNCISRLYGHSLQGLYWNEQRPQEVADFCTLAAPEYLASFRTLRVLDLRHFVGVDLSKRDKSAPRHSLPLVEDLIISTHTRSLAMASALSLPSLRNVTMKTPISGVPDIHQISIFLQVHGHSLITVDLPSPSPDSEPEPDSTLSRRTAHHVNPDVFLQPDVCPNLTSLTFPITSPPLSPYVHKALRRIGIRGIRADGLYPDKPTTGKAHLLAINSTRYPNLELVQTVGFLVDADTDGLIKDIFIWWVEKFEKHGIDFLDGEGVLWAYTEPTAEEAMKEVKDLDIFVRERKLEAKNEKEKGQLDNVRVLPTARTNSLMYLSSNPLVYAI